MALAIFVKGKMKKNSCQLIVMIAKCASMEIVKSFNEWKVCISQVLDVVTSRMQKFWLDSQ